MGRKSVGADGVAVFLSATSKDSLQGSGKITDVKEALMIRAKYGARKGRALVTPERAEPWRPPAVECRHCPSERERERERSLFSFFFQKLYMYS